MLLETFYARLPKNKFNFLLFAISCGLGYFIVVLVIFHDVSLSSISVKGFHLTFPPYHFIVIIEQRPKIPCPDHHPWPLSTMAFKDILSVWGTLQEGHNIIVSQRAVFSKKRKGIFSIPFPFDIFSFWPNLPLGRVHCYMCVDRVSILSLAPYWRTPGGERRGRLEQPIF